MTPVSPASRVRRTGSRSRRSPACPWGSPTDRCRGDAGAAPGRRGRRRGRRLLGLASMAGGPGQVPSVHGQLGQVHVHQGGSGVLLAPRHRVSQRQAGIVAPCLRCLSRGAAKLTGRVGQLHVRGSVSGRGCLPAPERPPGGPLRRGGRSVRPRRTWGAVSDGRARGRLLLTRSPQRATPGSSAPYVRPMTPRVADHPRRSKK